jgi:hypothetical protein
LPFPDVIREQAGQRKWRARSQFACLSHLAVSNELFGRETMINGLLWHPLQRLKLSLCRFNLRASNQVNEGPPKVSSHVDCPAIVITQVIRHPDSRRGGAVRSKLSRCNRVMSEALEVFHPLEGGLHSVATASVDRSNSL